MGQPFIVLGDKTSHGGTVVEASPVSTTGGKGIACVGHKVSCPIPGHGSTVIVSGDNTMLIDGKPAARHGDKVGCGATLIASQQVSTAGGSGGGRSASPAGTADSGAVANAAGTSVPNPGAVAPQADKSVAADEEGEVIEQYFEITDLDGQPLSGFRYDLYKAGALHSHKATLASGRTSSVSDGDALKLVVWLNKDGASRA